MIGMQIVAQAEPRHIRRHILTGNLRFFFSCPIYALFLLLPAYISARLCISLDKNRCQSSIRLPILGDLSHCEMVLSRQWHDKVQVGKGR